MKHISLKWKVTLWYAGMFLLLLTVLFGCLFSVSDQTLRTESVSTLEDAVWDFIEEIEVDETGWKPDDGIRFYENGIVFSLYDREGHILGGSVPKNFPSDTTLKAYAAQEFFNGTEKWTTYDAAVPYGEDQILWVRGIYDSNAVTAVERQMLHLLLIFCPLLILLALLVGYTITRRALLPMEEIQKTAEEISEGSDLSRRILTKRAGGEVRRLADTFNHMFARLEASFEKERQFTSDASHELRTPLSVILSQSEYGLLPDTESEELREGMEIIHQQAESMRGLLSQLLLLARADRGTEQLQKEPLDLGLLAKEALQEMQGRATERNIALKLQARTELWILGDRDSLRRVFRNLLENAIQYGREDGWVCLSLYRERGQVVCQIEDNGIGIEPENLEKIWNRFYRVDPVRGSGNGNSGLGLSIVRWIVEAHDGSVEVKSQPGEGSMFCFCLPELSV